MPWPAVPDSTTQDRDVDALLERLGSLPALPVSGHGEVYAGLHDDLLAALNGPVAELGLNPGSDAAP